MFHLLFTSFIGFMAFRRRANPRYEQRRMKRREIALVAITGAIKWEKGRQKSYVWYLLYRALISWQLAEMTAFRRVITMENKKKTTSKQIEQVSPGCSGFEALSIFFKNWETGTFLHNLFESCVHMNPPRTFAFVCVLCFAWLTVAKKKIVQVHTLLNF